MNEFWPEGLSLKDLISPYEMLRLAQQEWEQKSDGAMVLVLERDRSEDGHTVIIVYARYIPSNRTASLLKVIHRQSVPYPVTIHPRSENLPAFLKRSHYQPGIGDFSGVAGIMREATKGRTVTNRWVSDTPSEFREKLAEAFNLSDVKTAILGLASEVAPQPPEDSASAAQNDDPTE